MSLTSTGSWERVSDDIDDSDHQSDDDDDVTGETGDINSLERTKVDLEIVRRRETKWVEMMGSWDTYMMRSVSGKEWGHPIYDIVNTRALCVIEY